MSATEPVTLVKPLSFRGATAYAVHHIFSMLVDTGPPCPQPELDTKLAAAGVDAGKVTLILLTHSHLDHVGNARRLKELTGAKIACHRAEAKVLETGIMPPFKPVGCLGMLAARFVEKTLRLEHRLKPDILIDSELDLLDYGIKGRVIPTPGHTRGGLSVVLDSGDALIGDLTMPRYLLGGPPDLPVFTDNGQQVRDSLKVLLGAGARRFHPGHGKPFGIEAARRVLG